jgi:hypothetical protein
VLESFKNAHLEEEKQENKIIEKEAGQESGKCLRKFFLKLFLIPQKAKTSFSWTRFLFFKYPLFKPFIIQD